MALTDQQISQARSAAGYSPAAPTPGTNTPASFGDYMGIKTPTVTPLAPPVEAPDASLPVNPVLQPLTQILPNLVKTYAGDPEAPAGSEASLGAGAKMWNDVVEGAKNLSNIPSDIQKEGLGNSLFNPTSAASVDLTKGLAKAGGRTAADFAGTVFAPIGEVVGAGIKSLAAENPEAAATTQKNIDAISNFISDNAAVQKFAMSNPNAGEDFTRFLNLAMSSQETGKIDPVRMAKEASNLTSKISGATSGIANSAVDAAGNAIDTGVAKARTAFSDQIFGTPEEQQAKAITDTHTAISKDAAQISDIQNNYSALRKVRNFSPDQEASNQRVAASNVLADSVDTNGTIHTKDPGGAVDQYKKMTLDNAEGVVRKALVREGATANLNDIQKTLTAKVMNSGLEGADLKNGLNLVKKEVSGLGLRADENGKIPLENVHDAKINQTKNINYSTPPEVSTARKAIASGLKTTVEDSSSVNVKEINGVLSKYLEDVKTLENLDGRKVQGGKLGKYAAGLTGNIAGGVVGSVLGGGFGGAAGSILGGEIASAIKGHFMANTFGEIPGAGVTQDPTLTSAIDQAKSPRLALPAPAEGAPRSSITDTNPILLSPKAPSSVEASESGIRTGQAPIDAERMSLAESASTQEEKQQIQELTPEEVTALNQITDKSIKAQMVKAYLENQSLSTQRMNPAISLEKNATTPSNINSQVIPETLPQATEKASPVKGDTVILRDIKGTFKVMEDKGASMLLKDTKTGRNITVGKNNIIKK